MAEPQEPPIWVDELVARNEELLKAVAENQALGRLADAVAYQELFVPGDQLVDPNGRLLVLGHGAVWSVVLSRVCARRRLAALAAARRRCEGPQAY